MSILTEELADNGPRRSPARAMVATYQAFRSYRARRRGMRALAALNDHTLKDIGISRSEIGSVYYGSRCDRRLSHDDMC